MPKIQSLKANIVTLGCSKNSVDSEFLAGALRSAGFEVVHEGPVEFYDAVIINTCGFILDAKEESIDTILYHVGLKQKGLAGKILVVGCLAQRYHDELKSEFPEVDAILGVHHLPEVLSLLAPGPKANEIPFERLLSTPAHYAWLKISEGCDRQCSFCAIPMIRGKHLSRSRKDLISEVAKITAEGVKELILIAQDLTSYGKDLYGKPSLIELVEDLLSLPSPEWIRLHYTYPSGIHERLLEIMANEKRICAYLDVPFQHVSDPILQSMRRGHKQQDIRKLLDMVRTQYPQIAVRTTFIVGYPGETEANFRELLAFMKEYSFDRLGAFMYSHEEDTPAFALDDAIPPELKEERLAELMALQEEISFTNNQRFIGKKLSVLLDECLPDGSFLGRTEYDSPEIDNEVHVQPHDGLTTGAFADVVIHAATAFELEASKVLTFEE